VDIAAFRSNFPEFADTTAYPNTMITFWSGVAENLIREEVWVDLYQTGVQLYVAHELTLARQNVLSASTGGVPGQSGGIASNKSVGSVSVGYDLNSNSEKDAGWWNMTTYGKQLYRLIKIFGAGCIQL
jgi:hypothetical protein